MERLGVDGLTGEAGYTTLERRWARPTFDVHGLWGGYQGEGGKTVLPAKAGAKFSFRLVPHQDPAKIAAALRQWVGELCPPGIRWELIDMHGGPGVVGAAGQPLPAGRRAGHRARLRPPAGVHPRGRLDSHRHGLPREAGSRYAAAGLGPGRRQRPQPQREILPGRFPPRHPGQRSPVERTGAGAARRRMGLRPSDPGGTPACRLDAIDSRQPPRSRLPCSTANSSSKTPNSSNRTASTATPRSTSGGWSNWKPGGGRSSARSRS